jgi:hypothetical protein
MASGANRRLAAGEFVRRLRQSLSSKMLTCVRSGGRGSRNHWDSRPRSPRRSSLFLGQHRLRSFLARPTTLRSRPGGAGVTLPSPRKVPSFLRHPSRSRTVWSRHHALEPTTVAPPAVQASTHPGLARHLRLRRRQGRCGPGARGSTLQDVPAPRWSWTWSYAISRSARCPG